MWDSVGCGRVSPYADKIWTLNPQQHCLTNIFLWDT
jgi:hypothetical protein